MIRQTSVAGQFYPLHADELTHFFHSLSQGIPHKGRFIIVPHAGYIYSGECASFAYSALHDTPFKTCVVIGPSHRYRYEGVSIADVEGFDTPLGLIECDKEMTKTLKTQFNLPFYPQAHTEHSTETQFPFIKHFFPHSKMVEIIYSDISPKNLSTIIEFIAQNEQTIGIISSDLSHYYTQKEANYKDSFVCNAIEKNDFSSLCQGEACGKIGIEALLSVAKHHQWKGSVLDYRTSALASGDTSRVVGYISAIFS